MLNSSRQAASADLPGLSASAEGTRTPSPRNAIARCSRQAVFADSWGDA